MSLFTLGSRLSDGLPLFATDAGGADAESHRQQAKDIMRRIDARAPSRMSIDAGPNYFCYLVEDGMVFLSLAERAYPRKLAFAYLADVHRAFADELFHEHGPAWRAHIDTASKPYAFLKFERNLHRLRREFADPTNKSNTAKLAGDLHDIQHIMRKNIAEVLDRGEKLEHVSRISSKLVSESKQFKWGAKRLNLMDRWRKLLPYIVVALLLVALLWWRFG